MDRILVDTNIILDWLGKREPYFRFAQEVFKRGEESNIEIFVSTMSFISTEYILRKQIGKEKAKQALSAMRTFCKVATSGNKEIDLSLASSFRDFADAFQYYSAVSNDCTVLLTRDSKGFKLAKIAIMSAEEYIKSLSEE